MWTTGAPTHRTLEHGLKGTVDKDVCDGDLNLQHLAHTVSKADADNRVSSQLKEVIGEANPGDPKSLLPQDTQRVFLDITWSHILASPP